MKFLDENGRIGGKINLVDLVTVVVAVLVIALIGVRMGVLDKADDKVDATNTTYVVEVEGVRSFVADAIQPGDKVFTQTDSAELGTITDVRYEQTLIPIGHLDGTVTQGPVENRINLYFTIETGCKVSNNRYFVNGVNEISLNSHMEMKTKYYKFTGLVTEIQ